MTAFYGETSHAYVMKGGVAPTVRYVRARTTAQAMEHVLRMARVSATEIGEATIARQHGAQMLAVTMVHA